MRVIVIRCGQGMVRFAPLDHTLCFLDVVTAALMTPIPTPGEVGALEVVEDGDEVLAEFRPELGVRASLATLKARGRAGPVGFELTGDWGRESLDLVGHGVLPSDRDRAAKLGFWRVPGDGLPLGRFEESDLGAWTRAQAVDRERLAAEARDREVRARVSQVARDYQSYFVNPYTFVGFPAPDAVPERRAPPGHGALASDCFSGTVTAVLRARSPLLIQQIEVGTAGFPRRPDPVTGQVVPFIPGSSLHGALRSLHETLTGSCLRVFDEDFVPAYRDAAAVDTSRSWMLGVVGEVDRDGRPTRIERCTSVQWVEAERLVAARRAARLEPTVAVGQRYTLDPSDSELLHGRKVNRGPVEALSSDRGGGGWVAAVTDPAARAKWHPYYCALGELPAEPTSVSLTDAAWVAYGRAVAGARMHTGEQKEPEHHRELALIAEEGLDAVVGASGVWQRYAKQEHENRPDLQRPVGPEVPLRWHQPRRWFSPGQVVWVAGAGAGPMVEAIKLSVLWRSAPSTASAGERVPELLRPCVDPGNLCPSCRLFGSADVRTDGRRREAAQHSYRGHVRVADAIWRSGATETTRLPRAGAPRPGAGQFYLAHPRPVTDDQGQRDDRPGQWGQFPDRVSNRPLRGRKFYWHTDPDVDRARRRWSAHDIRHDRHKTPAREDTSELMEAGTEFVVTVRFDGLGRAEIGGVLAALQPERLLAGRLPSWTPNADDARFAIHVGGGKPLGLGSCVVTDLILHTDSAESRYLRAAGPVLELGECVAAFAAEYVGLAPIWTQAAAALQVERVDSRIVSYPTRQEWGPDGACTGTRQHESFRWFGANDGQRHKERDHKPFPLLPDVTEVPAMAVDPDTGRGSGRPTPGGQRR